MQKQKMLRAPSSEYWTFPDLNSIGEIGLYYGFTLHNGIHPEKKDIDLAKKTDIFDGEPSNPRVLPEELLALLRNNFTKTSPPLPLMFVRKRLGHGRKNIDYCFDILGTSRSIADATVIAAAHEAVCDQGFQDVHIEINSVGDRDSFGRFMRELTGYYRKHLNELDPECRQALKKGPLAVLHCSHEKCQPIKEHAPHPMNYLSEPSRNHFKEVLELLEMAALPYTINNFLIDNPEYSAHTVFAIYGVETDGKNPELIARGTRWLNLAKKLGLKKDVPGISAAVLTKDSEIKTLKKIHKPKFYLIQMGQEAKLRSLGLIEILRQAKIPVYHSLTKDKFAAQLGSAEHLKVPYVLIIGQKESIENTVLVRDMSNRSQDTIRIDQIADYLKRLLR